jgi:GNAT superfamily N-acetyltransferase
MTITETITPSTGSRIRRATATDRTAVAATVAAGFFDDPVVRWLLPDLAHRREVIVPMFEVYVDAYLPHGETYLSAAGNGAAVWLPPGAVLLAADQEQAFVDAVVGVIGYRSVERLLLMEETFAAHKPAEPYHYCQFLSTVPAAQGRDIGSALLRDMLARADADGRLAYHEATSRRNRALYERHGYVDLGELVVPGGGPTLWRMWREPR